MECGELCVMISGVHQMPKLSADNWDIQTRVIKHIYFFDSINYDTV